MLNLRLANYNDMELLFKWANDHEVRVNSINSNYISWQDHQKWFKNKIHSSTKIFILENKFPIGQARLDEEDGYYVIDYSVDLHERGKGYGKKLLELLKKKKLKYPLRGIINQLNIKSIKSFEKAGFMFKGEKLINNKIYLIYEF